MVMPTSDALPSFEIRFMSLFRQGRGLAFPCDALGNVDLDALSERARNNYLFARAMVGRDNGWPRVCGPNTTDNRSPQPCRSQPTRRAGGHRWWRVRERASIGHPRLPEQ